MNFENLSKLYHSSFNEFEKEFTKLIISNLHLGENHIINIINELSKHIYKYDLFNNGEQGYLYCIYNEVYNYYGRNTYKLGISKDIKKNYY